MLLTFISIFDLSFFLLNMFFCVFTIHVNLDMMDSMGPGKLVRHMQNRSYTYEEYAGYHRLIPMDLEGNDRRHSPI